MGLGASAGGLEALRNFFAAVPAKSGAAFVVIQHLAPDHPLCAMNNVVLTPHIGGATYDTEANHSKLIADDVARILRGDKPVNCVNPEVL